jgi:protein involved in polysaccharide export with SLBB domain
LLTQGYGNLVSVIGEINNAGRYSIEAAGGHVSGMLAAARGIAAGGGDTLILTGTGKGTQRGIVRHRRDASGRVKEESVPLDDDVRDQVVIYVK